MKKIFVIFLLATFLVLVFSSAGRGQFLVKMVGQLEITEGYKLSKHSDYATDDRDYTQADTLYVWLWSSKIDPYDVRDHYCQLTSDKYLHKFYLNYDPNITPEYSYTGSFDLSSLKKTGDWNVQIFLKTNPPKPIIFNPSDVIHVSAEAPPTRTLNIYSSPVSGVPFTLDEISYVTPFSTTASEGTHTVGMPLTVTIGVKTYNFKQWEDGSTNSIRTISLTTDMAVTAAYELYVPPPGWIEGTVTDASTDVPIAEASITADGYSATTNDSGNYRITDVPPGDYAVEVSATGYYNGSKSARVDAGVTTTVDFALKLVPPTHTLSIYSSPVTGVFFTLDGESHVTPLSTTLDDGNHTVVVPLTVDVAEKTYNFKNWEDGSTNLARIIDLARDTSITAYYEEKPSATHVLSVSSSPITEFSFTVDGTEYTTPWSGILIEGTHTVSMPSSVTVGGITYNFVDWDDRTANPTRSVDLTKDTTITAYYASPPENSAIHGIVTDNLGSPIVGARVTIVETGRYVDTLAEPAGYYEFIDLTPGTYTIKVEVSEYNPSQASIVADPAGTYTQDFSLTPTPIVTPPLVPSELWQLAIGSLTILGATTYLVLWRKRSRILKEIKENEYRISLQDVKLEAMLRELDNLQQKGLLGSEKYETMRNEIEGELTKIRGLKG